MPITESQARAFAESWYAAWNTHDMGRIMAHYAPAIEHSSPFIKRYNGTDDASLRGIAAVRDYFDRALKRNPTLRFDPLHLTIGLESRLTVLSAAVAATVCFYWYRKAPFALQAALLIAGALLATPYVYLYDTVVLAVAGAYLVRVALAAGFLPGEEIALLAAAMLIFAYPFFSLPLGFAAIVIVFALVLLRLIATKSRA